MEKEKYKAPSKTGLPPGVLIHVGKKHGDKIKISQLQYNKKEIIEKEITDFSQFKNFTTKEDKVLWMNIDGLHETELIGKIGEQFSLHPLVLEDILNTNQRPKLDEFDNHLFISIKMLGINAKGTGIVNEQISLVYGANTLLTFQEREGDIFDALRGRIREDKGNIRSCNADYLLYRIIDTVVDHYFLVADFITEKIELLEEKTNKNPDSGIINEVQNLKKELVHLRRVISPMREIVNSMEKDNLGIINKNTNKYLRDVYDHVIQLIDIIETQKDILSGVRDTYLSDVSNKMNKTMQFLTSMSSIFIPLTFMAGIYGMNFEYIPELHLKNGYYYFWIFMIVMAGVLAFIFKRKKWF